MKEEIRAGVRRGYGSLDEGDKVATAPAVIAPLSLSLLLPGVFEEAHRRTFLRESRRGRLVGVVARPSGHDERPNRTGWGRDCSMGVMMLLV